MAEENGPLMISIPPQTDASDKPFVTSSALDLSHVHGSVTDNVLSVYESYLFTFILNLNSFTFYERILTEQKWIIKVKGQAFDLLSLIC